MTDRGGILDSAIEGVVKLFVLAILLYLFGELLWNMIF